MLKNAYFLAKIGADTAENERDFAEILPIGRRVGLCVLAGLLDGSDRAEVRAILRQQPVHLLVCFFFRTPS